MKNINTLSCLEELHTNIKYEFRKKETYVLWGEIEIELNNLIYSVILDDFFRNQNQWYYLGTSMDNPIPEGLGEYIKRNSYQIQGELLGPRYASLIAAIMYNEGWIDFKGKRPILIKKI